MKSPTYRGNLPPTTVASMPSTTVLALQIAKRFGGKKPAVQQLRDTFGMSRATAFRWRAAFDYVNGGAA